MVLVPALDANRRPWLETALLRCALAGGRCALVVDAQAGESLRWCGGLRFACRDLGATTVLALNDAGGASPAAILSAAEAGHATSAAGEKGGGGGLDNVAVVVTGYLWDSEGAILAALLRSNCSAAVVCSALGPDAHAAHPHAPQLAPGYTHAAAARGAGTGHGAEGRLDLTAFAAHLEADAMRLRRSAAAAAAAVAVTPLAVTVCHMPLHAVLPLQPLQSTVLSSPHRLATGAAPSSASTRAQVSWFTLLGHASGASACLPVLPFHLAPPPSSSSSAGAHRSGIVDPLGAVAASALPPSVAGRLRCLADALAGALHDQLRLDVDTRRRSFAGGRTSALVAARMASSVRALKERDRDVSERHQNERFLAQAPPAAAAASSSSSSSSSSSLSSSKKALPGTSSSSSTKRPRASVVVVDRWLLLGPLVAGRGAGDCSGPGSVADRILRCLPPHAITATTASGGPGASVAALRRAAPFAHDVALAQPRRYQVPRSPLPATDGTGDDDEDDDQGDDDAAVASAALALHPLGPSADEWRLGKLAAKLPAWVPPPSLCWPLNPEASALAAAIVTGNAAGAAGDDEGGEGGREGAEAAAALSGGSPLERAGAAAVAALCVELRRLGLSPRDAVPAAAKRTVGPEVWAHVAALVAAIEEKKKAHGGGNNGNGDKESSAGALGCNVGVVSVALALVEALQRSSAKLANKKALTASASYLSLSASSAPPVADAPWGARWAAVCEAERRAVRSCEAEASAALTGHPSGHHSSDHHPPSFQADQLASSALADAVLGSVRAALQPTGSTDGPLSLLDGLLLVLHGASLVAFEADHAARPGGPFAAVRCVHTRLLWQRKRSCVWWTRFSCRVSSL